MLATHYSVLIVLAGAATAGWLFRPNKRTQVTSLASFVAWSLAAVLGGDVYVVDTTNETLVGNVSNGTAVAVEGSAELVATPLPASVRWLFGLLAVLSALAGVLYVLGVYPPTTDDPMLDTDTNTNNG